MALEHEIKLPVGSLDGVRSRLRECGATLRREETFEDNWVLDDGAQRLRAAGCLLRVRRWGDVASVTFKGPARFTGAVKTRREIETTVGDPDVILELFAEVGLTPLRRYQKRRETWTLGGVTAALDETPMGCFVELEGPQESIAPVAATLHLDPSTAVPGSYLRLWEDYRAVHPEAPTDMVFA
jgi:adenylate cyclase class 2